MIQKRLMVVFFLLLKIKFNMEIRPFLRNRQTPDNKVSRGDVTLLSKTNI